MKPPSLDHLKDEELLTAYQEILRAKPQLPHFRRARLAILDLLEARGREADALVARLKTQLPVLNGGQTNGS